jgi:hypothetical protein
VEGTNRRLRNLHDEMHYSLHILPYIINVMKSVKDELDRAFVTYGGMRNKYKILIRKPESGRIILK